jgi:tetratricopeptide (TPR) repeat protein
MAREVDVRYPSAAAFAADLEAFLRGEPVQAGPPSSALRIRRALRRHRRKLVLGGVLLAAGSLLAWGWRARVDLVRAELAATHGRVALARISEDRNSWLRALNVAMAQHPDEPAFLVQRAIVWLALNRAADATRDVAAAHALRPDDGELTELVHALGAAARIAAADAASADDLAAVKKIARAGGERAEFLHLRGVLLGFLGRWDEAEPLLQRVRVLDRSFGVESDLMVTNLRLGRPQQALAELERFTAARPVPSVVCVRCRVLATLGDWAGARVERDRLTQLAPASAYAAAARIMLAPVPGADVDIEAEVARAQCAPDWEEAQDAVQRAAGAAHHLRREPAPAIAAYTAVLARDPQDPKLHSLLGICCFELAESQTGDERADTLRRGRAALAAAARLSRHLPFEADYHAGMLAFYDKRYADAVAHLRRAAQQAPADPKRQRPLGFALAMLVNVTRDPRERVALIEECVAVHRRECELAPNDARATMLLRNALEFLAHSLQRLDDPRAAEVAREAAALATEPRR